MSFKAPVFTNKGKQLYASCLAGKNEIIFTNIKLGDGELMGQAIADLEDLVNPIKTIVLNDKKLIGNDQVLIRAVFKNIDISSGFYWREVGLYAQDPENPEDRSKDILFCYQNAGDTAEYIPSASSGLIDKILSMSLVVSDVNSVNVSFFSESYALKEDLDEHKTDENAHSDIFSQYVKKSGDTMSGALVMADSAQIFKNKDDHFLGLYGGSNFNNGAFFEICGKDHEEQSGNFNIYANNGTLSARLNGTPAGALTWGGKNIVRSVNGVNADAQGNVKTVFPSDTFINVASFPFTAPSNGWITVNAIATASLIGTYVHLSTNSSGGEVKLMSISARNNDTQTSTGNTLPVKKGDVVKVTYNSMRTISAKFVYAEGEI